MANFTNVAHLAEAGPLTRGQTSPDYYQASHVRLAPAARIFNFHAIQSGGFEGSGLGLALVKKIVSIYNSRIWVESAGKEKGKCFRFTLPAALIQETRNHNSQLEAEKCLSM